MAKIERFEDIEGWQLARRLTQAVYAATRVGEFRQDFGLRDQIQRAAGSAMHNIAEGFDGGSHAEFVKFLRYAQRSCSEVQSQLYAALDQRYITQQQLSPNNNSTICINSRLKRIRRLAVSSVISLHEVRSILFFVLGS